jgi:head-tail adaptor
MAICTKIRRKSKRICIGSLNKKIVVNMREIQAPNQDSVDFSELFTAERTVWAMVETVNGVTIFDETNIEHEITHNVYMRYVQNMTPEKWLKLLSVNGGDDVYFNIIRVENFGELNQFYRLLCTLRGKDDLAANFA